jgi:DNA-binding NtrC family response regulator/tetratricopeptide (TPR) repeat protein
LYTKFLRAPAAPGPFSGTFARIEHSAVVLHHWPRSMDTLLADRFVQSDSGWIDIATGTRVRIHIAAAGSRREQFVWADSCGTLSRIRHPLLNALVDYGALDAGRTFEAYEAGVAVRATGPAASRLLTHAVRFLETNAVPLTRTLAPLLVREVRLGSAAEGRPIGIMLQPRRAFHLLADALAHAGVVGVATIDVCAAAGMGLRTLRLLAARTARMHGYVPVDARVLARVPALSSELRERHVAVLSGPGPTAPFTAHVSRLLVHLGAASARRHVHLRFHRQPTPRSNSAFLVDPMGATAMHSMIYMDDHCGPDPADVCAAVRVADGSPGRLLEMLGAQRIACAAGGNLVHEVSPAYVVSSPPERAAARCRVAKVVEQAEARAARLAAKGRHATAIRLLKRASAVFEGRGDVERAGACLARLGWLFRDRGAAAPALASFERARRLESHTAVSAAVGLGVLWTDDKRFSEAEAALRSAHAAADMSGDRTLSAAALLALSRCLLWQQRISEAAAALEELPDLRRQQSSGVITAEAAALAARVYVAAGDAGRAMRAALAATKDASASGNPRAIGTACRALAQCRLAAGDLDGVRDAVGRGLAAASAAHRPLTALRLRLILLEALGSGERADTAESSRLAAHLTAACRLPMPTLLRDQIATTLRRRKGPAEPPRASTVWGDLQSLLEMVQSAPDDRSGTQRICAAVHQRLQSAAVVVLAPDVTMLARAGRPFPPDMDVVRMVLAGAKGTARGSGPARCAAAVRFGGEVVGAVACMWPVGTRIDAQTAEPVIQAAALALGASVRGLLDRAVPSPAAQHWPDLVGVSSAAIALRDAVARAARAPFPVLVEGESGSGKELVARAIHRLSPRRERRLCTINCAAIADDLVEAELFGHARGAFTGAATERAGLFEEADAGSLFLDEVGELSARAQAKLLRVLQDGELRRVGENIARKVDTRVIAATNRRLEEEVAAGRFRTDLRFRLDVVRIAVPPLRERAVDIPLLAAHFWTEAAARVGSHATLAPETIAALSRYDWPGNVRELQNAIASIAVHAPRRGRITPACLPAHLARNSVPAGASFEEARAEFERRFVRAALARTGGHRLRTARALGVTRQGLAKMLRRLQIEPERLGD